MSEPDRSPADLSSGDGASILYGCPVVDDLGAAVLHCDASRYLAAMTEIRDDGYEMLSSLTGVDYLTHPGRQLPEGIEPERFEVVVELVDLRRRRRLRVRCQVPGEDPALASLFGVWPGSEAHERETYDMFGIRFDGHPDPTRILMPEDWEGHPLRKDYATGHVPVQFKESPGGR